MAAELFTNFADFKSCVGGRVNQSIELGSLETHIWETARRHIVPYLSLSQYEGLLSGTQSTAQNNLRPYVKRPLALLTLYEYSKVGGIEFGESGMHRIESETRKSAYRYQEKQFQQDCLEKGYEALEEMLRFLDINKGTYTAWADSTEASVHRRPLLNYASDMRMLTHVQCDRYTFEALRPIFSEVEVFGVEKQLPRTFWSGFITRHLAGNLTDGEKLLRIYIRQSIAHRAMEEAIKLHWIHIKGGRVFIQEEFGEQNQVNQTMPTSLGAGLGAQHAIWADRHTARWVDYIRGNPTLFPTVFDVASGGSNTGSDAWHIDTADEAAEAALALHEAKCKPIFRM